MESLVQPQQNKQEKLTVFWFLLGPWFRFNKGSRKCTKHKWLLKQPFVKSQLSNQHQRAKGFSFLFFFLSLALDLGVKEKETDKERRNKTITPSWKDNIMQLSESDMECVIFCFCVLSHYTVLRSSINLSCLFHNMYLQYGESFLLHRMRAQGKGKVERAGENL